MKRNRQVKIKKSIVSILNGKWSDLIRLVLIVVIAVPILLILQLNIFDYLKLDIAMSVSVTLIIGVLIKIILSAIEGSLEDANKLTIDYDNLVSRYKNNLLISKNINKDKSLNIKEVNELLKKDVSIKNNSLVVYYNKNNTNWQMFEKLSTCSLYTFDINGLLVKGSNKESEGFYIFPVLMNYLNVNNNGIVINDSLDLYCLPSFFENNYFELINAHVHSNIYNNKTIRLFDINLIDNKVILNTQRTTFYNTLVSNRAIDYNLSKNVSIRELFEFGPSINSLKDSKLSNHIGFQVIVETSDNEIVFIKRSKKVSVAKNTLACSVSASLKTKYALNDNGEFTLGGLDNAILNETVDELGLNKNDFCAYSINDNIVSFYRDLVEGGKPHFIFYLKSNKDKEYITKTFNRNSRNVSNKRKMKVDGNKLIFVRKDKLEDIVITPDLFIIDEKIYDSTPSTTSSVVMFINYLKQRNK